MSTLAPVETPQGEKQTYRFEPPYSSIDFAHMAGIIEDATLTGFAVIRLIHDDKITVTTIGAKE